MVEQSWMSSGLFYLIVRNDIFNFMCPTVMWATFSEDRMSGQTITIIVVIVVLIVLISISLWLAIPMWSLRKNKQKAEALKATGKPGEATVLQVDDTGMRVNGNPRVNVLLEIRIPGYSAYQVQKTVTIPTVRASQIQVGSIVSVLADPTQTTNPDKVGILLR
jgi:flagellar basal body-associated protein FliL